MGGGGEIDARKIEYNDKMTTNKRTKERKRNTNSDNIVKNPSMLHQSQPKRKNFINYEVLSFEMLILANTDRNPQSERNKMWTGNVMELCLLSSKCPLVCK